MPYTDRERKEIVEAIVRRQAHRILKVHFAQDLTLSTLCTTLSILSTTLSTTLPKILSSQTSRATQFGSSWRSQRCAAGIALGRAWRSNSARCFSIFTRRVFFNFLCRKVFFDLYSLCLFQFFVPQVIVHKIESFGLTRKELLKFREGLGIASNLVICLWTCEPGIGGAGKSKTMRSEAGAVNSSWMGISKDGNYWS